MLPQRTVEIETTHAILQERNDTTTSLTQRSDVTNAVEAEQPTLSSVLEA